MELEKRGPVRGNEGAKLAPCAYAKRILLRESPGAEPFKFLLNIK